MVMEEDAALQETIVAKMLASMFVIAENRGREDLRLK